jgi:cytochrome oxidase assembly protein ShyY1
VGRVGRELLARRWLPWHAALVVALVAFILLGRWQLDSYEASGREDRAGERAAAVPLTDVTRPGGRLGAGDPGRKVSASGRYDEANQVLVPGRRLHGETGYLVVTPLLTESGIVVVNRGWVVAPGGRRAQAPPGVVQLTGVLQPSESDQDSGVDSVAGLPQGQIPYIATIRLLNALPYAESDLYDGYVVLTSQRPRTATQPELVPPRDLDTGIARWRNLAYALNWWFFAAAAVFFWWSVIRRAARERAAVPS